MDLNSLKRKVEKELSELSMEALKNTVFRYDKDYFNEINQNDGSVIRFRNLIEKQDIESLNKEWPKLSNRFVELERDAGYKGRPLIMDYYHWYDLDLKELKNRLDEK